MVIGGCLLFLALLSQSLHCWVLLRASAGFALVLCSNVIHELVMMTCSAIAHLSWALCIEDVAHLHGLVALTHVWKVLTCNTW